MAADEALVRSAAEGIASLRFYGWSAATLSLGYFQPHSTRFSDPLLAALPWVRRPSGGAAYDKTRSRLLRELLPHALPRGTCGRPHCSGPLRPGREGRRAGYGAWCRSSDFSENRPTSSAGIPDEQPQIDPPYRCRSRSRNLSAALLADMKTVPGRVAEPCSGAASSLSPNGIARKHPFDDPDSSSPGSAVPCDRSPARGSADNRYHAGLGYPSADRRCGRTGSRLR